MALRFVCFSTSICDQRADESQTDVFDGAMVVSAMFTLNLFHPGVLLRELDKSKADFGKMEEYENQGSES